MKLAFVTPRYGAEIPEGAEHACRLLAEQVSLRHHVEVLTTCARDPLTWDNQYSEGADRVRGVLVRRFAVNQLHDHTAFQQLSASLFGMPRGRADEEAWVRQLGPTSPALVEHLKRQHRAYDAVVFFSLCHATTVFGIAAVPDRSVLFPYLRLHPALRFGLWPEVFGAARAVGYVSAAERILTRDFLRVVPAVEETVGIGVDTPAQQAYPRHQQNPEDTVVEPDGSDAEGDAAPPAPEYLEGRGVLFRRRHRLSGPLVLYAGRIRPDNGSPEMLEYFDRYAAADGDTTLVLTGVKLMNLPEQGRVRPAGILPDRERMTAYEAADVAVAPEPDDLMATTVLESMAVGTPVLASGRNAGAVEHCRRANGGLYYADGPEFAEALQLLMTRPRLREQLGESGRRYVSEHCRWDVVLSRFERLMMRVKRA